MPATLGLSFLAGLLSVLSPCVLPLLPIVLGAAAAEHRAGPLALAAGLALAYVAVGLFVLTVGFAVGLDGDLFRKIGAVMMMAIGAVMLVPRWQTGLAVAGAPIGDWSERRFGGRAASGVAGQFGVGLLLGAVWSPCVGPTLGAALGLAAQSRDLPSAAMTMLVFGIGAALPLALLGMVSREALLRWRGRLGGFGQAAKIALGAVLLASGIMILTGLDKVVETALVNASPDWLTELTTRF